LKADLLDSGMVQKYIASVYWAAVTITTVGYGDITPTNNYELLWAVVIIVAGVSIFSYFLGGLASNFASMFSEKDVLRE